MDFPKNLRKQKKKGIYNSKDDTLRIEKDLNNLDQLSIEGTTIEFSKEVAPIQKTDTKINGNVRRNCNREMEEPTGKQHKESKGIIALESKDCQQREIPDTPPIDYPEDFQEDQVEEIENHMLFTSCRDNSIQEPQQDVSSPKPNQPRSEESMPEKSREKYKFWQTPTTTCSSPFTPNNKLQYQAKDSNKAAELTVIEF